MSKYYIPRVCPDCGDRRIVHAAVPHQVARILAGEQRCLPCHAEHSARPDSVRRVDCSIDDVDEIVVQRLLDGQHVCASVAEKLEAMRQLPDDATAREIADLFHISTRQVQRYRSMLRQIA